MKAEKKTYEKYKTFVDETYHHLDETLIRLNKSRREVSQLKLPQNMLVRRHKKTFNEGAESSMEYIWLNIFNTPQSLVVPVSIRSFLAGNWFYRVDAVKKRNLDSYIPNRKDLIGQIELCYDWNQYDASTPTVDISIISNIQDSKIELLMRDYFAKKADTIQELEMNIDYI